MPSSCHHLACVSNIPYSLALQIVRICSKPALKEQRFSELKTLLLQQDYKISMINSAINKARKVTRSEALKYVAPSQPSKRPVYVVTYDPRLPSLQSITTKHWRSMTAMDSYLTHVFPAPPMIAYKQQQNLKDLLVRAKINKGNTNVKRNPLREKKGMYNCKKQCSACPFVLFRKLVKINTYTWNLRNHYDCETKNIIYLIECDLERCQQKYVGETKRKLKERFLEHKRDVENGELTATGHHFNLPGHNFSNMKMMVIEKMKNSSDIYRKEREKFHIKKFNTFYNGINKTP